MLKPVLVATLLLSSINAVSASSDDAWAEFAAEVEAGCLAATADMLSDASAIVDPYGSENYGLALVTGETVIGSKASIICIFDKQTRTVEVGGELDVTVTAH